jgi:hypothetical protein
MTDEQLAAADPLLRPPRAVPRGGEQVVYDGRAGRSPISDNLGRVDLGRADGLFEEPASRDPALGEEFFDVRRTGRSRDTSGP